MMNDLLNSVRQNRETVLQVELAAMLHDLDKMYAKAHGGNMSPADRRQELEKEVYLPYKRILMAEIPLPAPLLSAQSNDDVELADSVNALADGFIHHHSDGSEPMPLVAHILNAGTSGADGIDSEMAKMQREESGVKARLGSKYTKNDKETITPFGAPDSVCHCVPEDYQADLDAVLQAASSWAKDAADNRDNALHVFQERLSRYLGETRWPLNDVTLWAHSYAAASLAKAITAKMLIESAYGHKDGRSFSADNPYSLPLRNPSSDDDNATAFCGLLITLDRDALLARAQKAGDVAGIADIVDDIQKSIRHFLEVELPVGNVNFQDSSRQFFLLPYLNTWPNGISKKLHEQFVQELSSEIEARIVRQLKDNKCEELAFSVKFSEPKLDDTKRRDRCKCDKQTDKCYHWSKHMIEAIFEQSSQLLAKKMPCRQSVKALHKLEGPASKQDVVCDVCGVRYRRKNEVLCPVCKDRRTGRAPAWAKEVLAEKPDKTIWLPEVVEKDDNKLVLISLSFDLSQVFNGDFFDTMKLFNDEGSVILHKKPAPSRIRRSWETCERFFDYVLDDLCPQKLQSPDGWRQQRLKLKIKGVPAGVDSITLMGSELQLFRHCDYWLSTSNVERAFPEGKKNIRGETQITLGEEPSDEQHKQQQVIITDQDVTGVGYTPLFEVSRSPVFCEFVVSASHAGDLINAIHEEYLKRFRQVQLRLPLSVGCVFFGHKFPLYLAIEAARKMQRHLLAREEACTVTGEPADGKLIALPLKPDDVGREGAAPGPLQIEINRDLPCTDKPDVFHANVAACDGTIKRQDQLQAGDQIKVRLGRFDFILLDTAGRLMDITPTGVKHPVLGMRSAYPLAMWGQFKGIGAEITTLPKHQLKNIEGALCEKRHQWRELGDDYSKDPTVKSFMHSLLFNQNAFGPEKADKQNRNRLQAAAQNGVLVDAIDFFTRLSNAGTTED